MKWKNQKGGFFVMLLGALGPSMLGNILPGKGVLSARKKFKRGKGYNNMDHLDKSIYPARK